MKEKEMPRKRNTAQRDELAAPSKNNGSTTDVKWGGFIDVRLDDGDKAHFATWEEATQAAIWSLLDDAMGDGCKFGLSYDDENQTYVATFTSETHAGGGYRYVLTARSGTWERATALLCYKHHVMLEADWSRFKPRSGRAAEV